MPADRKRAVTFKGSFRRKDEGRDTSNNVIKVYGIARRKIGHKTGS